MYGVGDGRFFDRFARVYDRVMPAADQASLAGALSRADGDIDRLLDLGGGTGRATIGIDVPERIVIDISRPMLRRARTRTPTGPGRPNDPPGPLAVIQGDAGQLSVTDDAIDAAVVVDAFHHMPAQAAVINEVQRVLRPGGVFVLREFDPTHPVGWLLAHGEHGIGMASVFHPPTALAKMLADAGVTVESLTPGFEYTIVGTNR